MVIQHCKKGYKAALLLSVLGLNGIFIPELYADERRGASALLTQGTKDFLSDPARTGSLVGTILVGSAVANPLAPILGSVAGFMIGKSSAFSSQQGGSTQLSSQRSLLTTAGTQITSLSGLTGNSAPARTMTGKSRPERFPQIPDTYFSPSTSHDALSVDTEDQMQAGRTDHLMILGMSVSKDPDAYSEDLDLPDEPTSVRPEVSTGSHTQSSNSLQKQLAYSCSNVQSTQPMPPACFYLSR